jgi:quinoprotein glucose dehydrogenase
MAGMLRSRLLACIVLLTPSAALRAGEFDGWTHYGGSQRGMQYSSLQQITRDNVAGLEQRWLYRTGEMGQHANHPFAFQANPILVDGKLYLSTGSAIVIALDPSTGREIWRHDPHIERMTNYAEVANRGVSAWLDQAAEPGMPCRRRIFVGTLDARLIALDASSGKRCAGFGDHGEVRLNLDVRTTSGDWVIYTITSPPVIVNDVVVVGSAIGDNQKVESELGIIRGLDARSGAELWRWDPVPRNDTDPAWAAWQPDEALKNGSANAWAPLAADAELGLVYVPTGSASPDFFGGERQGDNRYANSLVALRARNGEVVWYQQLVHHDLWDYDLASQPTLVELEHDGRTIPAVLQGTKMGLVFSFDRRNGAPLFEIEERPVPQGGVAGEHLSPTQPFPVAPPPVSRIDAVTAEDAWGLLGFDRSSCRKKIAGLRSEGIYTPPGLAGSIGLPGFAGGINWGGLAFDPARQLAVAFTLDLPTEVALIPRDKLEEVYGSGQYEDQEFARQSGTPYAMRRQLLTSPLGVPCTAPPFGRLVALDMRRGQLAWRRSFGSNQDITPAIVPNLELGMAGLGGPIVTAGGLVFIAAAMDNYLRAFDIDSGEKLWEGRLPAGGQATPMTYLDDSTGKQFVVIAAGGHPRLGTTLGDYVVAFALP